MLDVAQFRVDPLQRGSPLDQHFHAHVIADRHLVEEPAQLGLQQGEALGQAFALGQQFRVGRGRIGEHGRRAWAQASQAGHGPTTTLEGRLLLACT